MKEITKDHIEYMERTIRNYYFLLKMASIYQKKSLILKRKIEEEMKAAGIDYDKESGTYNNTDTPYINSLIHTQSAMELEATHCKWAAKDLDKYNKLSKKYSSLTNDHKATIYWLLEVGLSQSEYADKVKVSRQAINNRLESALKRMLEVE